MMPQVSNIRKCTGATLVEVLVTLFVTSVGLLGVTGLEIVAKSTGHEAIQRTTAAMLAHEYIERMRANPQQLADYSGVTLGGGTLDTPATLCDEVACDAAQTAAFDVWQWERTLDGVAEQLGDTDTGGLLNPQACVSGPAGGAAGESGVYTVSIAWRGTTPLSNPTANACGESEALYGDGNAYRRLLTMQVFVSDNGF
jgi:type IV pilus assembly protein PilV